MKLLRSRWLVLSFVMVTFTLVSPLTAFAQTVMSVLPVVVPPAPPPITATTISTATVLLAFLGVFVGFIVQGVNSGSLFGVVTIPKPALPYLGLAGSFLSAFVVSANAAPTKDTAAWINALLAGLLALGGVAIGVTAKQHIDAHLRDKTPVVGSGSNGAKVDAVTKAANDITPPSTTPPAAQRTSAYRVNPRLVSSRLAFPRWITRTALAVVVSAISMASTAAVVESTGCANGAPTPQTQAEIAASEALGACIEKEYVADATKTPPPAALQIALDIASSCGAEAVDVVGAFTTTSSTLAVATAPSRTDVATAAQTNAPALHVAVMAWHQKVGH